MNIYENIGLMRQKKKQEQQTRKQQKEERDRSRKQNRRWGKQTWEHNIYMYMYIYMYVYVYIYIYVYVCICICICICYVVSFIFYLLSFIFYLLSFVFRQKKGNKNNKQGNKQRRERNTTQHRRWGKQTWEELWNKGKESKTSIVIYGFLYVPICFYILRYCHVCSYSFLYVYMFSYVCIWFPICSCMFRYVPVWFIYVHRLSHVSNETNKDTRTTNMEELWNKGKESKTSMCIYMFLYVPLCSIFSYIVIHAPIVFYMYICFPVFLCVFL